MTPTWHAFSGVTAGRISANRGMRCVEKNCKGKVVSLRWLNHRSETLGHLSQVNA